MRKVWTAALTLILAAVLVLGNQASVLAQTAPDPALPGPQSSDVPQQSVPPLPAPESTGEAQESIPPQQTGTPEASGEPSSQPNGSGVPAPAPENPAAPGLVSEEIEGVRFLRGLEMDPKTGHALPAVELAAALGTDEVTLLTADGEEAAEDAVCATGMTAIWAPSDAELEEQAFLVVKGDVTGTGKISLTQLSRLAEGVSGTKAFEGAFLLAADMDGNGRPSLTDLTMEAALYMAYLKRDEPLKVDWIIPQSADIPGQVREVFQEAAANWSGAAYIPQACVATSADGKYYCLLCETEPKSLAEQSMYSLVYLHTDDKGVTQIADTVDSLVSVPRFRDVEGAWKRPASPDVPADVRTVLAADDETYAPVACVAEQMATSRSFLVCLEKEDTYYMTTVEIASDGKGDVAEKTRMTDAYEPVPGGWQLPDSPSMSSQTESRFRRAAKRIEGYSFSPIACVGISAGDGGTSYRVLCRADPVRDSAPDTYAILTMYVTTGGEAQIIHSVVSDIEARSDSSGKPGGWVQTPPGIHPDVREALAEADNSYRPAAQLGYELDSGMVYTICAASENDYVIAELHVRLSGSPVIRKADVIKAGEPYIPAGPWTLASSPEVSQEMRSMFSSVTADLIDLSYAPVALLGQQTDAGINYCFLSTCTPGIANPKVTYALVIVHVGTDGTAQLGNIITSPYEVPSFGSGAGAWAASPTPVVSAEVRTVLQQADPDLHPAACLAYRSNADGTTNFSILALKGSSVVLADILTDFGSRCELVSADVLCTLDSGETPEGE